MAERNVDNDGGSNFFFKSLDSNKIKTAKRVNVGKEGETPKKIIDISANNGNLTLNVKESNKINESVGSAMQQNKMFVTKIDSSSRPKTSRGISHPSPDDFYNYVVPSPDTGKIKATRLVVHGNNLESQSSGIELEEQIDERTLDIESEDILTSNSNVDDASGRYELSSSYLLGLNLEGVSREKQIALVC